LKQNVIFTVDSVHNSMNQTERILAQYSPASHLLDVVQFRCCNKALQISLGQRLHKYILQYYIHIMYTQRRTPVSAGKTFYNLLQLRETADNTKHYI